MITLHDYQQKAFGLLVEAFKTRVAALVVMATGLGKTIVAAFWAKEQIKKKRKGLFLCHDNGILDQAIVEFRKVLGNQVSLKAFYGSEKEKDFDIKNADIVFASFQSLVDWKDAFLENEFDFIIVDESHHGQAPTYKEVIQYFKPEKLLGITATPDREDLQDIREIFGNEVVNFTLEESIANGWLTKIEYHIMNNNLSHWQLKKILKEVLEEGKRYSVKQLNEQIFIKKRDEEIARLIQEYAGESKKAIIFCEGIKHANNFQSYLPNSSTYHSEVTGGIKENRSRLEAFREGRIQYILVVGKFNEGIDIPDAEIIVFLRCTDSKTIFFQQLGRGLRKIFGKEKVVVLDFVANCERLTIIKEMAERSKEFAGNNFALSKEFLHVSGAAFDFIFSDEQVDILEVIRRIKFRFISDFPYLLAEYSKLNPLPPETAIAGTHRKYIWNCQKCGHEWQAQGSSRLNKKTGCPKCAGYVPPSPTRLLSEVNPGLEEYYLDKNKIPFKEVTTKDKHCDFFILCQQCNEEFQTEIYRLETMEIPPVCRNCFDENEKEKLRIISERKKAEKEQLIRECCVERGKIPNPDNQDEECAKCHAEDMENKRREEEARRVQQEADLRKKCYASAEEALGVALKLGAVDSMSYWRIFKQDPKLPNNPCLIYREDPFIGEEDTFFSKLKKMALA